MSEVKKKSKVVKVIWMEVDGIKFYSDGRGYWQNSKRKRLHQYMWEKYNGKIPDGYHVHHKDLNKENNEIDNLELMEQSEHLALHAQLADYDTQIDLINNARKYASKWHGTKEGREWHKKHYEKMKEKLHKEIEIECEFCGKKFMAIKRSRFCCNNCKSAWRKKSGIDDVSRICTVCGCEFTANKYSTKRFCSDKCRYYGVENEN